MAEVSEAGASHQSYVSRTDDSDPHVQTPTENLGTVVGSDLSFKRRHSSSQENDSENSNSSRGSLILTFSGERGGGVRTPGRLFCCFFCRFGTMLDQFTAPVWPARGCGLGGLLFHKF